MSVISNSGLVTSTPFAYQIPSLNSLFLQSNLLLQTSNIGALAALPTPLNLNTAVNSVGLDTSNIDTSSAQRLSAIANIKTPGFTDLLVDNVKGQVASMVTSKFMDTTKINAGIDSLTSGLTNSNGVATKMIGGAANAAIKSVANSAILGAANSLSKSFTSAALGQGLKQGAKGALSSLGKAGGIAGLANAGILMAFSNQRKAGWENAVNLVGGVASAIPGVGWGLTAGLAAFNLIGGLTGRKSISATNKDWLSRQAQSAVAGGYNGAMNDIADAESREGSYSGWNASGRHRADRRIAKTNAWKDTMNEWQARNDLNDIRSNLMDSINGMQYSSLLSGGYDLNNSGRMLAAKNGAKLLETITEAKEYTKRIKSVKHKLDAEKTALNKEIDRYYDDPLFSTKSKFNDDFHLGGQWSEDNKMFTPSLFSLLNHDLSEIKEALNNEFPDAVLNISEEVEAFRNGGTLNSKDPNVIPSGALHARLNHMDNKELTAKGIPVVAKDGDKLELTAEIERNEIIFNLSVTNKLEELMKDGSAKAALEAGKLLTEEILHNTVDNTGLLKEVE